MGILPYDRYGFHLNLTRYIPNFITVILPIEKSCNSSYSNSHRLLHNPVQRSNRMRTTGGSLARQVKSPGLQENQLGGRPDVILDDYLPDRRPYCRFFRVWWHRRSRSRDCENSFHHIPDFFCTFPDLRAPAKDLSFENNERGGVLRRPARFSIRLTRRQR
jgi:hypothetical protein